MIREVGKYWVGFEYPDDESASRAFERCNEAAEHVGVTRFRSPMKAPHRHFYVVALGEDREKVEYARELMVVGSICPFEPEAGVIEALRKRRLSLAVQGIRDGRSEVRQVTRTPKGRVLHRDGTLESYHGEEE